MVFRIQKLAAFHTDISMNHDMTTTQGKLLALRMMIIITMTIIFKAKIRAQFVPLVEFMSLVITRIQDTRQPIWSIAEITLYARWELL